MSIEELVNRAYTTWADELGTSWTAHMRAALTEQAETHTMELRAYEATVANLEQRIRELQETVAEYDRRIAAVGGVAINSVSREHNEAEASRLNDLYEKVRELEAQRVPEGWQLVPVEPTDQMIDAGCDEADAYRVDIDRAWRAMLSVATRGV